MANRKETFVHKSCSRAWYRTASTGSWQLMGVTTS
uniref:Uncharacterized protein n=1 Tax=Arundo donax TaxID=35708 RepID=A0A0A9BCV7_ARUDO